MRRGGGVAAPVVARGASVLALLAGFVGAFGATATGSTTGSPTPAGVPSATFTATTAGTTVPPGPDSSGTVPPGPDSSGTVWLCRPGLSSNPCVTNLTTTVVGPGGASHVQRTPVARKSPIDCFYVYPTVSAQSTINADLTIDPAERFVAMLQASRFSSQCRVYAPMYPQITRSGLTRGATGADVLTAYDGVQAAWRDYLTHYNKGRGVVFIGHSQGASMLIRLLKNEVDPKPAVRKLVVSALLMGGNVTVPIGKTVGGDFKHIPACQSKTQTGCVLAYSSFLDPPPVNSLFGRVGAGVSVLSGDGPNPKLQVLCVDPAAVAGGTGTLQPYAPTGSILGSIGAGSRSPWVESADQYRAHCAYAGGISWLQVSVIHPGDTRPSVTQTLGPTWGLHLDDVNLALGNLVSLVRSQARAYVSGGQRG